jgi:hypothetical protein
MAKLNMKALSLSLAIIAAALVWIIGLWFCATGFGKPIVELISSFYAGLIHFQYNPLSAFWVNFSANLLSVLILSLFAFVDGIILGIVFGTLYNLFLPKTTK